MKSKLLMSLAVRPDVKNSWYQPESIVVLMAVASYNNRYQRLESEGVCRA